MGDDDDRIRQKAHELWEAEGRPEGRAERHWEEASEIIAVKDSLGSTLTPVGETLDEPVEPTSAIEVQGDVPGMTDLGDETQAPSWSNAADLADEEPTGAVGEDKPKRAKAGTGSKKKPA